VENGLRHGWLALYTIAAWLYRLFVVAGIAWLVYRFCKTHRIEIVAHLVLSTTVILLVSAPAVLAFLALRDLAMRQRIRWLRAYTMFATTILACVALLSIRVSYRVSTPAVLRTAEAERVYVEVPGYFPVDDVSTCRCNDGEVLHSDGKARSTCCQRNEHWKRSVEVAPCA